MDCDGARPKIGWSATDSRHSVTITTGIRLPENFFRLIDHYLLNIETAGVPNNTLGAMKAPVYGILYTANIAGAKAYAPGVVCVCQRHSRIRRLFGKSELSD
jgi:hypothetical protein